MIKSFKHKGLQRFFETGSKNGIQAKHENRLRLQLTRLNVATNPLDMDAPGWKLHKLKGAKNQWSIWINGNWRLTFVFEEKDALLIDYQDYH